MAQHDHETRAPNSRPKETAWALVTCTCHGKFAPALTEPSAPFAHVVSMADPEQDADPAAAVSRARLAALFDEHAPAAPTGGPGLPSASADPSEVPHTDEADEARRKLRELFGDPDA